MYEESNKESYGTKQSTTAVSLEIDEDNKICGINNNCVKILRRRNKNAKEK